MSAVTTGVVLTTVAMPTVYTCSTCGVRWVQRHECPSVNRSTSAPRFTGGTHRSPDPTPEVTDSGRQLQDGAS